MENSWTNQILYKCQLCPDPNQGFGPFETKTTITLKKHMVKLHNTDKILTNWGKYFNACKQGSNLEIQNQCNV